jgi:hypothetical protein
MSIKEVLLNIAGIGTYNKWYFNQNYSLVIMKNMRGALLFALLCLMVCNDSLWGSDVKAFTPLTDRIMEP